MNQDIRDLLDELEDFMIAYKEEPIGSFRFSEWLEQKRSEYADPKGDCCG